ncbi:MAG: hypothetical protein QNJ74_09205 [Trichodesmium sp. MO_231.B1]|nr:hypothetical protein [Trichodesmium sp. MO_231.B1]
MLNFVFPPTIQAGIASGAYEVVRNAATGQLLGIARDRATGRFVGHAVGAITNNNPLFSLLGINPIGGVIGIGQMVQTHRGFQAVLGNLNAIQSSLGVLQATTALIGIGTVSTMVLSAVNLHQTLKLREDIKQLRLEVKDGFIDLKNALKIQGLEIIQRLDEVAEDIKFEQHRLEFIKAYGKFLEATKLIKISLSIADQTSRNTELANARQTLSEAVAIYNNPHLLLENSVPGDLRRAECSWAIEQAIILTYQLQNEPKAVSDRLSYLQDKIRQDSLTVINRIKTEGELDFIFPEITRIYYHDLAALNLWQNQIDWLIYLPPSELKLLESADFIESEITETTEANSLLTETPEQQIYEDLKQKSHPLSLQDQISFLMKPELRKQFEFYISQESVKAGYKTLGLSNLQTASNMTIANLYYYFKIRDNSETEIGGNIVAA